MLTALPLLLAAAFQQTQVQVSVDSKKGTSVRVTSEDGRDSTRDAQHAKRKAVVATEAQWRTRS